MELHVVNSSDKFYSISVWKPASEIVLIGKGQLRRKNILMKEIIKKSEKH